MPEDNQMNVAKEAAQMALSLWMQEKPSNPTASDASYLKLVTACSLALQGRLTSASADKLVEENFQK